MNLPKFPKSHLILWEVQDNNNKNSRTVATHIAGTQKARVPFFSMGEDVKETQ